MLKSKQKLDLTIKREVTQRVIDDLGHALAWAERIAPAWGPAWQFTFKYFADNYLSKYVDENTDSQEDRRKRAIVKWLSVEDRNRRTNERLYNSDPSFNLGRTGGTSGYAVLMKAAEYIRDVIGDEPPEDLLSDGGFTGGASTSRKRAVTSLVSKFMGTIDATPRAWKHLEKVILGFEGWTSHNPEVLQPRLVRGNVLFTVPKTAIIDRVACKEPDGNIFGQRAIGNFIRRRLRSRARVNLNDQSINRGLAKGGSISGKLATIDLSSASDSLTTSLVSLLLPRGWFNLLDDFRCDKTFIDGASHANEMFSSMGNGFTFELESMVFWAIARASCHLSGTRGRISVYGDDIIIPSGIAPAFLHVLAWCGFTPNVKKTFCDGPFRESCGGHYYRGYDVTPLFLKRPFRDASDLILFLNQLRKWMIITEADIFSLDDQSQNPFTRIWLKYSRLIPRPLHGGYSMESRTQLASPGFQQCELIETKRASESVERRYQLGMYLSHLCLLNKRTPVNIDMKVIDLEAPRFGGLPIPTGRYVMRRCTVEPAVFGVVRPLLSFEQCPRGGGL